jgi:hypothetical protein
MLTEYTFQNLENSNDIFWIFAHLSREDQRFVCDHIDELMRRTTSPNTLIHFPVNIMESEEFNDSIFSPCVVLSRLVRRYQSFNKPYAASVEPRSYEVYVASDLLHMVDAFEEYHHGPRNMGIIRSIAQMKFDSPRNIIDIIGAAGSIVGTDADGGYQIIFHAISQTVDMLKAYLKLKYASFEANLDWSEYEDNARSLVETEYYLTGEKDEEDIQHLTACMYYILSIYNFAGWLSEDGYGPAIIYEQYLFKRLRYIYGDDKFLHEIYLQAYSWFTNKLVQETIAEHDLSCIHSSKNIVRTAITPVQNHIERDPFTMSQMLEYKEIKELIMQLENQEDSLIIDAICRKTNIKRDTLRISPDIDEELLTMYLAEFNKDHPLVLPDKTSHSYFIIKYEEHLYALFQIEIGGRPVPGNLYAIRQSGSNREEREYTLLQFKKDPMASYIFYY